MGGHTAKPRASQANIGPRKKPSGVKTPDSKARAQNKAKPAIGNQKSTKQQQPNVHFDKKDQQRSSTLLGEVCVLSKNERPSKKLWWLAGGRTRGSRGVPTGGELRDRKKVEQANRDAVGFLGTILGVRAVNRLPEKKQAKKKNDKESGDLKVKEEGEKGDKRLGDKEVKKGDVKKHKK